MEVKDLHTMKTRRIPEYQISGSPIEFPLLTAGTMHTVLTQTHQIAYSSQRMVRFCRQGSLHQVQRISKQPGMVSESLNG